MTAIKRHWPLLAALAVLHLVMAGCLATAIARSEGHFAYVLDDPYIHMAVAKNFAAGGVWGVTPYGFSSSSSSILWPLLLSAAYLAFGPGVITPFVLNLVFASILLWVTYALLKSRGIPPWVNFLCLLGVSFCAPLPAVVYGGLEHTLQMALAVPFLYLAALVLSERPEAQKHVPAGLKVLFFALAPLITMTRFEGAFMVAAVGLLAMLRGRIRQMVLLGVLGAAPLLAYGFVSWYNGSHFLPNSVLLKGNTPALLATGDEIAGGDAGRIIHHYRRAVDSLGFTAVKKLVYTPHLLAVAIIALFTLALLYRNDRRHFARGKIVIWVFLATMLLHLQFADTGYFFRYDAYLVVMGLLIPFMVAYRELIESFRRAPPLGRIALVVAAAGLAMPFVHRAGVSLAQTPRAATNIYQQQCQMGLFLERFYTGKGIAAVDIGAINFYADIDNLDLMGLASVEVADARKQGRFSTETVRSMAAGRGVKIAVLFGNALDEFGGVPPEWQEVGRWKITDNVICKQDTVTFYAVDPGERRVLAENLRQFSPRLPAAVVQFGPYLEPERSFAQMP